MAIVEFFMSPTKYKVEEYTVYQPQLARVLDTVTNNTTTETKQEKSSDFALSAFNFMAQLGGLYSFFRLVFGSVLGFFYDKLLKMELVNNLKDRLGKKTVKPNKCRLRDVSTSKIQPVSLVEETKYERKCQVVAHGVPCAQASMALSGSHCLMCAEQQAHLSLG